MKMKIILKATMALECEL